MFSDSEVCLLNLYERRIRFYGIYIHAIIVEIRKYTNKCTILQFKIFTIKTPELRRFYRPFGSVHQYLYKCN